MERTLRLIQRAHEGDKEARDILVEENVGLVWSIVRRFQNRGVESEDLFQIGTIGLIKTVGTDVIGAVEKVVPAALPIVAVGIVVPVVIKIFKRVAH